MGMLKLGVLLTILIIFNENVCIALFAELNLIFVPTTILNFKILLILLNHSHLVYPIVPYFII